MSVRTIPEKKIYVCDRCGTESVSRPWGSYTEIRADHTIMAYNGDVGGGIDRLLLCPVCQQAFYKFIANVLVDKTVVGS